MKAINDGGPAFPPTVYSWNVIEADKTLLLTGMSLRDWLAGMALQGLMGQIYSETPRWAQIAKDSYDAADAILAQRNK